MAKNIGNAQASTQHTKRDTLSGQTKKRSSSNKDAVRMLDIKMVWDAVEATRKQARGARRRASEKHAVVPATITEAIKRVERAFAVTLFRHDMYEVEPLTAHGLAFLRYGDQFLTNYHLFRKFVQEAEDDQPNVQNN